MIKLLAITTAMCLSFGIANSTPDTFDTKEVKRLAKAIHKIQPELEPKYIQRVATVIYTQAKRHRLDPMLLLAIAAQESMFDSHAQNCTTGRTKSGKEGYVCTDFGMFQVSYSNVKIRKLSVKKVLGDLDYAANLACTMLLEFKDKYEKKEPKTWWSRYNSSSHPYRQIYQNKVCRFYQGKNYCKKEDVCRRK
jgi:hypothetical protein